MKYSRKYFLYFVSFFIILVILNYVIFLMALNSKIVFLIDVASDRLINNTSDPKNGELISIDGDSNGYNILIRTFNQGIEHYYLQRYDLKHTLRWSNELNDIDMSSYPFLIISAQSMKYVVLKEDIELTLNTSYANTFSFYLFDQVDGYFINKIIIPLINPTEGWKHSLLDETIIDNEFFIIEQNYIDPERVAKGILGKINVSLFIFNLITNAVDHTLLYETFYVTENYILPVSYFYPITAEIIDHLRKVQIVIEQPGVTWIGVNYISKRYIQSYDLNSYAIDKNVPQIFNDSFSCKALFSCKIIFLTDDTIIAFDPIGNQSNVIIHYSGVLSVSNIYPVMTIRALRDMYYVINPTQIILLGDEWQNNQLKSQFYLLTVNEKNVNFETIFPRKNQLNLFNYFGINDNMFGISFLSQDRPRYSFEITLISEQAIELHNVSKKYLHLPNVIITLIVLIPLLVIFRRKSRKILSEDTFPNIDS